MNDMCCQCGDTIYPDDERVSDKAGTQYHFECYELIYPDDEGACLEED